MKVIEFSGSWECPKCKWTNGVILHNSVKVTTGLGIIPNPWSVCSKCNRFTDLDVKKIEGNNLIIKPAESYRNDLYEF